ncbi:hypothetical protein [Kribbella sp. HUAS MG21]|jgi:hypothetical protein|uniref:Uncharacterized protein n=1 Tax=Kribbella sp. HUAS MG21 TaxID=3160966 RepID=A0AAU7TM64_9ACTN
MSNGLQVSRSVRWRWWVDNAWARWRRIHRLYVGRAYGWGKR